MLRLPCARPNRYRAFTLIEILVVVLIVAVLMGLAFPAFQGVQNSAKKTQVKNDLVQLVNAVNAYYTEYGKFPLPAGAQGTSEDFTYSYDGNTSSSPNSDLIKILQNEPTAAADNPRGIVFFSGPIAKKTGGYGIQMGAGSGGLMFLDPWGKAYSVCIDADYNGKLRERGTGTLLPLGVATWSLGKQGDWNKSGIASWK